VSWVYVAIHSQEGPCAIRILHATLNTLHWVHSSAAEYAIRWDWNQVVMETKYRLLEYVVFLTMLLARDDEMSMPKDIYSVQCVHQSWEIQHMECQVRTFSCTFRNIS
jgi:hypothetical protein